VDRAIQIEVVHADVLTFAADLLALKHAQSLYGAEAAVVDQLARMRVVNEFHPPLPRIGEAVLIESEGAIAATRVLLVGVDHLANLEYRTIREFALSALSHLKKLLPLAQHVALTVHGVRFGLDETESFRAEIAGLLDGLAASEHPEPLARISIVERDAERAERLTTLLDSILPGGVVGRSKPISGIVAQSLGDARESLGEVGHDSRQKPHVFVAMPFSEEYADRFHYGIRGAVNAAGYLCERADLSSFTGDVMAWVKDRIDSAALVVADLTSANPNVYLEVGYAWGRGVKTVLLVAEGDDLGFDVQTQRCLVFRSIRHLEELLTTELKALTGERASSYSG
jgi:hypothetical protein